MNEFELPLIEEFLESVEEDQVQEKALYDGTESQKSFFEAFLKFA